MKIYIFPKGFHIRKKRADIGKSLDTSVGLLGDRVRISVA